MTAAEMPSSFKVPDLRKTLSARVLTSIHAKIADIRELWREAARLRNATKEEIDAIDNTHVVEVLLGAAVDGELQQYGGFATTPDAKAEQLKALRAAHKNG